MADTDLFNLDSKLDLPVTSGSKSTEDRERLASMKNAPNPPIMNTFERAIAGSRNDIMPAEKRGNSS